MINAANILTGLRIVFSFALLFYPALSPVFCVLYTAAGITDMIDGTVAEKTNTESVFGARFDTAADFIFVIVCLFKLIPILNIPVWIYLWIMVIAVIKVFNIVLGIIIRKKIVAVHSVMNKITGLLLFLLPLTLSFINLSYSAAVVCATATFAAIQEGHFYQNRESKMIIKTERLILRPWDESDAESLYKYAKKPEVGPIAGWPVHTSVENSLDIIKNVLSKEENYAVCLKEDNAAIGSIGLIPPAQSHTEIKDTELEIGFWIGKPFWGNGYIPEAVRALQKHAFEDLGCTALWCGYYDGNVKSKRCQEKCGFVYHHTEENKPCALMGDIRTEHFTRITKEEWLK